MIEYCIQTYTGKVLNFIKPTEDMICIEDIAHHLSIENRYGGASKFPYSVAYHSILVSQKCQKGLELDGLLHDAHEAYCKDIPTPLKKALYANLGEAGYFNKYIKIADRIQAIINQKFNVKEYALVDTVDKRMANTERLQLLNNELIWPSEIQNAIPYDDIFIHETLPKVTEEAFLLEFNKYKRN